MEGITLNTTVNEILRRFPKAVELLNGLGLDTCCGGAEPWGRRPKLKARNRRRWRGAWGLGLPYVWGLFALLSVLAGNFFVLLMLEVLWG
ncbi:hypothetical protein [Thermus tenuipuniceus]|uniref:hypothetical protein n=1 Tax=Thermus tenuipuniceus TaxID=2078690 RepID=UPI001FC9D0DD|nr:hypothetical protein [Thermus tenuipuniceus]